MGSFRKPLIFLTFLFLISLLAGCATTVSSGRMGEIWKEVQAEYPQCHRDMPKVVWLSEPIYLDIDGETVSVYGAYVRPFDTVILQEGWADEEVVSHEFEHACGGTLGERPGRFVDPGLYVRDPM